MPIPGEKCSIFAVVTFSVCMILIALRGFLKPVTTGCTMTYMYPTYIPVAMPTNLSSTSKYGLFLYHEGWRQIDFNEHLKKLNGVPVLFIPGNGGSYKQVRSLGAESSRAFQGGPRELTFYQEALLTPEEEGKDKQLEESNDFVNPNRYERMLDWFAVDLEGEHSAMDSRILEEHTEYVVHATHRILDLYMEADYTSGGGGNSLSLQKSVILVGHSMGGFVARAAVVHPCLRESAVETIITLSTPHQSPPLALQPSLSHLYSLVNQKWKEGYSTKTILSTHRDSRPALSHVVIVSIYGGLHDYQIRSKLASLEGIVPSANGLTIASTGMKNVWLSNEHQTILWCNQLVVEMSHTMLSLIDPDTGLPFRSTYKRMMVISKMLRSGISQSFNLLAHSKPFDASVQLSIYNKISGDQLQFSSFCPSSINWVQDGFERDMHIEETTVTILAMDGRRRWMDIQKMASENKNHFIFVTNLVPCSGVRIHLWPKKGASIKNNEPASRRIHEVTRKMVELPAEPSPMQLEPGSQTEQSTPSSVLQLDPNDLRGFRFLTVSVAHHSAISDGPPPVSTMAVGQFFNPGDGEKRFSPLFLLSSSYLQKTILLEEDHPLALSLSFSISLGLLPITLSLGILGCGIDRSALSAESAGEEELMRLCKLRCFPPVALNWDSSSGLHVFTNLNSVTIAVDSSPAYWGSTKQFDETTVLLLVDPHCSYNISSSISVTASASRFFLLYGQQIIGFLISVALFSLMRQARAWELNMPVPSVLLSLAYNLQLPWAFFYLVTLPLLFSLILSSFQGQSLASSVSYAVVAIICYVLANGSLIILTMLSDLVFHIGAALHVLLKLRWRGWKETQFLNLLGQFELLRFISTFYLLKVVRLLSGNLSFVAACILIWLVCCVHPALGLAFIVLLHASSCHVSLYCFLAASFRSHVQKNEYESVSSMMTSTIRVNSSLLQRLSDMYEPGPSGSFEESQIEIYNFRHGLLVLHLVAMMMFIPSLVARIQGLFFCLSFPSLFDSLLCVGVIFHALFGQKPGFRSFAFSFPGIHGKVYGLSIAYLLAGYFCFFSALSLLPYRAFYEIAAIGSVSIVSRILERSGLNVERHFSNSRKHSHKH